MSTLQEVIIKIIKAKPAEERTPEECNILNTYRALLIYFWLKFFFFLILLIAAIKFILF